MVFAIRIFCHNNIPVPANQEGVSYFAGILLSFGLICRLGSGKKVIVRSAGGEKKLQLVIYSCSCLKIDVQLTL
jgi:hypothetical protein